MRIVTYHPRARVGDGGITNSVRRLSEAQARAGADVVIAYDGRGPGGDERGVEWRPVPHLGRGRARVPIGLGRAVGDADLVVLNSAWSTANAVAGRAARRAAIPYVLAPRGAYDPLIVRRKPRLRRAWWPLERRLLLGAAAVHVFFDSQGAHVEALGYRGQLVVAPNGVAVPGAARWDGGSAGHVLYLGRFDPEHKGLDLLVDAIAELPAHDRPWLRMHGSDWRGGKRRVVGRIRDLGLEDHITVGDPVHGDAKWQLLSRSLGLVYPSRWEGFGNSLAEAAALGVPTLATPYPLASFLADRGACLVVEPRPAALAAGLRQLAGPGARDVGAAAAAVVSRELTWDAVARRWLAQAAPLAAASRRLR